MKTSTLFLSLFIVNSSFLAGYFSVELMVNINPLFLGVSEFLLIIVYYLNTVFRDVRNAFDVNFTL